MHPAVKIVFITILIALTIAAVMYALRADPANHPAEQSGEAVGPASTYFEPALGRLGEIATIA